MICSCMGYPKWRLRKLYCRVPLTKAASTRLGWRGGAAADSLRPASLKETGLAAFAALNARPGHVRAQHTKRQRPPPLPPPPPRLASCPTDRPRLTSAPTRASAARAPQPSPANCRYIQVALVLRVRSLSRSVRAERSPAGSRRRQACEERGGIVLHPGSWSSPQCVLSFVVYNSQSAGQMASTVQEGAADVGYTPNIDTECWSISAGQTAASLT